MSQDGGLVLFDPDLPPGRLDLSRVLFLDFDGVLHPEMYNALEFCFVPEFCDELRRADPEGLVPVVISSSWRTGRPLAQLRSNFPADIARQIVGVTPLIEPLPSPWPMQGGAPNDFGRRQQEIELWMRIHSPAGEWFAIDDVATHFETDCENVFIVPAHGQGEGNGAGMNRFVAEEFGEQLREFLRPSHAAPRP